MLEINAFGALKISEIFIDLNRHETLVKKLINFSSVGGGFQAFPHFRLSDGMSMFQASTLNGMTDIERKDFIAQLPKGRLIEPEEIANLVLFLAAVESTYLHGAVIDASMGLGSRPGLISEL